MNCQYIFVIINWQYYGVIILQAKILVYIYYIISNHHSSLFYVILNKSLQSSVEGGSSTCTTNSTRIYWKDKNSNDDGVPDSRTVQSNQTRYQTYNLEKRLKLQKYWTPWIKSKTHEKGKSLNKWQITWIRKNKNTSNN